MTGDTNPAQLLTNVSIPDVLFVHLFIFYKDFMLIGNAAFDVSTSTLRWYYVGNLKGYRSRMFDLRGSNPNSHGKIQKCHGNVCDSLWSGEVRILACLHSSIHLHGVMRNEILRLVRLWPLPHKNGSVCSTGICKLSFVFYYWWMNFAAVYMYCKPFPLIMYVCMYFCVLEA